MIIIEQVIRNAVASDEMDNLHQTKKENARILDHVEKKHMLI